MRTPVLRSNKTLVAGIDSGFATLGIAVVAGDPEIGLESAELIALHYFHTEKAEKKLRRQIRVCTDDVSRVVRLAEQVEEVLDVHNPTATAIEWFQPNPKQKGFASGGWKAAVSVGAMIALVRARGMAVLEQIPADVKALVGSRSASKQDVEDWLRRNLRGFGPAIDRIARSHREHPSDAAAHALVGLLELRERRKAAGL